MGFIELLFRVIRKSAGRPTRLFTAAAGQFDAQVAEAISRGVRTPHAAGRYGGGRPFAEQFSPVRRGSGSKSKVAEMMKRGALRRLFLTVAGLQHLERLHAVEYRRIAP
jgi:hypothetical protein